MTCDAMILPDTAERTNGVCMPCKQGNRENIEASKEYYKKQKEYCPYRALWGDLVDKAYSSTPSYANLSDSELIYFSVEILYGEILNGGFNQYFCNSSGELYEKSVEGLEIIGDDRTLKILSTIKHEVFGGDNIPAQQSSRTKTVIEYEEKNGYDAFNVADDAFYEYSDDVTDLVENYLDLSGLIEPYKKDNKSQ
jgi:hypothetical protein